MHDPLGRRCTLVLLAAMALALAIGLLAWGPIPLAADALRHADTRAWLGLPQGLNVLACLPQCLVGAWGWHVTRRAAWPDAVRRPWAAFHLFTLVAGLAGALYHLQPGRLAWIGAHTAASAAFAWLALGALAERVDGRLGGRLPMAVVAIGVLLAGIVPALTDGADLRGLLLIEVLPVLLLPAGAVGLRGAHTRPADWLLMLAGYGLAKLAHLQDAAVLGLTGWLSGHALMHLVLAAVSGWLGYCAVRPWRAEGSGESQRKTSLNTAG